MERIHAAEQESKQSICQMPRHTWFLILTQKLSDRRPLQIVNRQLSIVNCLNKLQTIHSSIFFFEIP